MWLCCVGVVFGVTLLQYVWTRLTAPSLDLTNKHAIITGGSSGLGLAIASIFAKKGAKVSIFARSETKLKSAEQAIISQVPNASVFTVSCDVTDPKSVQQAIVAAESKHGVCEVLICSAGLADPGYFLEQDVGAFKRQMDVNYFGSLFVSKEVCSRMVKNNVRNGKVVFVSSLASLVGIIGYSQYSPTKYAVRGLAECLRNEMKKYSIEVSLFLPGNMDTPGFEQEEKNKPVETREIEGASVLASPESAAMCLFVGLQRGEFAISNEVLGEVMRVAGSGVFSPPKYILVEALISPVIVLVKAIAVWYADFLVVKFNKNNNNNNNNKKES